MTREELKKIVIRTINEYRKLHNGNQNYHYECGQVVGMVKAFKAIGLLEKQDQLSGEIMDELF